MISAILQIRLSLNIIFFKLGSVCSLLFCSLRSNDSDDSGRVGSSRASVEDVLHHLASYNPREVVVVHWSFKKGLLGRVGAESC